VRRAFKAIDQYGYNYLNEGNIRMFLRKMGHQVLKPELVAIIRRFDIDGDAKITF
jgi:Ca2+-binding EF-hand superfamily protein